MNNFNLCNNPNLCTYHPSFCQDEKRAIQYNHSQIAKSQNDSIKINKKENKTSFLNKFLKYLLFGSGIIFGLYGTFRTVKHFYPEFGKDFWMFFSNKKNIEDKSTKERTFLRTFNKLFKECRCQNPNEIELQELNFVENAFKHKKISEKEKNIFETKIKMRRKIRDFNNYNHTEIPLTPYGGVEKIVQAYDKVKDKKLEKAKFHEIIKYKIKKLNEKIILIQKREYNVDEFMEFNAKQNRTYDLINALQEIENNITSNEYYKCYYVDYTNQYIKNKAVAKTDDSIELENELCQTNIINLSKKTYENMFNDKGDMLAQVVPDCYLVGTLNSIINNPKRRCEFYQMFSEDKKSITFTFKDGFKVKFIKDNNGKPKLLSQHKSLNGALGYKMFEEAYALHRLYERAKRYKNIEIKQAKYIEKSIINYAQKDNKVDCEFYDIINECAKYIGSPKSYEEILEGGTIHEVANILFDVKTNSYFLQGYHDYEDNWLMKKKKSNNEVSQILTMMMKDGQSIVVGRDEFYNDKGLMPNHFKYNGIELYNSHFSVVRYYNPKTQEVHLFESNHPEKILILPLSVFNQQYSVLYGF